MSPSTHGLVVVDKPAGPTSHDVVARLRKAYGQRRVGHAGTLDPDATGVLLVGLGRATRLLRYLQGDDKEYRGEVTFGVATSTLDASGDEVERTDMPVTREQVEAAAAGFVGAQNQVPPMVSAVKVGGRRLYELARMGETAEVAPRRVRIDELAVEAFEPGPHPQATIRVVCSSGTYIRSLAADIGTALDGCAHLSALRRLRVGSFTLDDARVLDDIEASPDDSVLAPVDMMRDLPRLDLDADQARDVTSGIAFPDEDLAGDAAGPFALVGPDGDLLAVYERRRAALRPAVVLAPVEAD